MHLGLRDLPSLPDEVAVSEERKALDAGDLHRAATTTKARLSGSNATCAEPPESDTWHPDFRKQFSPFARIFSSNFDLKSWSVLQPLQNTSVCAEDDHNTPAQRGVAGSRVQIQSTATGITSVSGP